MRDKNRWSQERKKGNKKDWVGTEVMGYEGLQWGNSSFWDEIYLNWMI